MSARNPNRALNSFMQPLQSVLHCVTPAKLWRGQLDLNRAHILTLENPPSVELRRRDRGTGQRLHPVGLFVLVGYQFIQASDGTVRIVTTGYQYGISNQSKYEILAFHWHPEGISDVRVPHLHVGSGIVDSSAGDLGKSFSRLHIPTGHMSLARVVRMLITEFQVVPNRQDWETVVDQLLGSDAVR